MKDWEGIIVIVAILAITTLVGLALANGIDGMVLAGAMAIIGGLAGFSGKALKDKLKRT